MPTSLGSSAEVSAPEAECAEPDDAPVVVPLTALDLFLSLPLSLVVVLSSKFGSFLLGIAASVTDSSTSTDDLLEDVEAPRFDEEPKANDSSDLDLKRG